MKLLLDTHVFLWWDLSPGKLSSNALAAISDKNNQVLLSVASVWEVIIKTQFGKLQIGLPIEKIIESQQQTNNVQILGITYQQILAIEQLPRIHKDPFDRILIAQALVENATLISCDPMTAKYSVPQLW